MLAVGQSLPCMGEHKVQDGGSRGSQGEEWGQLGISGCRMWAAGGLRGRDADSWGSQGVGWGQPGVSGGGMGAAGGLKERDAGS